MKTKFIVLGVAVLAVGVFFLASNLQLQEITISARDEMLACEDCNHLSVEKSSDSSLNDKTIIPASSTLDIDQLIDSVVLTKDPLCLRGKPYRFNWGVFGISPNGLRFNVIAKEASAVCASL